MKLLKNFFKSLWEWIGRHAQGLSGLNEKARNEQRKISSNYFTALSIASTIGYITSLTKGESNGSYLFAVGMLCLFISLRIAASTEKE